MIVAGLLAQVLYTQITLYGQEKSQSNQKVKYSTFEYAFNDRTIPFHYFEMYSEMDILQRIDCDSREDKANQKHCTKIECMKSETTEDRNECLFQNGFIENPDDMETFYNYIPQVDGDYEMVDRTISYDEISTFLCSNTDVTFYSFNSVVETMIKLECEVLDIEDGYLRVHYHFGEHTQPFYRNDDMDLSSKEAMNITFNQTYSNF